MTKYYIAWNSEKTEGFITESLDDRESAITGETHMFLGYPSVSALGSEFYDLYGEDDEEPQRSEVDISHDR